MSISPTNSTSSVDSNSAYFKLSNFVRSLAAINRLGERERESWGRVTVLEGEGEGR